MTPVRPRVVVTGAAGRVGAVVVAHCNTRWELVATDLRAGEGVESLDVTDGSACEAAFAGADAVVHLAADPFPLADWEHLLPINVVGAHAVVAAAMAAGVRRLVLASSLHAVSGRPAHEQVRGDDPPRPGNLYGATKAWAEALGAWAVAASDLEVVALRIGYFLETAPDLDARGVIDAAAWLSARDAAALVVAAVEGPVDGFTVVNGVSANRYRKASYGDAERRLGYRPLDDAWEARP